MSELSVLSHNTAQPILFKGDRYIRLKLDPRRTGRGHDANGEHASTWLTLDEAAELYEALGTALKPSA